MPSAPHPTLPSRPFRHPPLHLWFILACAAALPAPPALAQDAGVPPTPSVYLQGSWARWNTDALTLGATLPWHAWRRPFLGGELRGHWDVYLSRWSFDGPGYGSLTLAGITPTLRLYPDAGRSAWFWEAGIGATLADRRYRAGTREFSTRFNFASHLGLGIHLGDQGRHELQLRLQHVSNAGIKHPNPGANFVQLRYALHF